MRQVDGWWWPDQERHLIEWMAESKNRLMINGRSAYQGKKQKLLIENCPVDRRRTMIDAGAHCGLWSFNFAHWFERIEAFEPVPDHRECFAKNVTSLNVTMHPFALGERPDKVAIRVDPLSTGGSFVKGKGEIEMRTIDSFELVEVDAFKIDVEGFEEFIIRGARETLDQWKPTVCVEQKRDFPVKFGIKPLGAIKLLVEMGYKTVTEISGDFIMRVPS